MRVGKKKSRRSARASRPPSKTQLSRGDSSPDGHFLDACLIVRDEEENLPGCLASLQALRPLLHAINVYDTGSVDRTVEIGRAAGCVVREGFWDDDFARARNESLAMSTARWAIVIDADERVVADPARLEAALRGLGAANVVGAELYHVDAQGERMWHTRYIKAVKPGEVRFVHPIHEIVDGFRGHQVSISQIAVDDLYFDHLGYSSADVRRRKAQRNHAVADAAVASARKSGDRVLLAHALRHRARSWVGEENVDLALADHEESWGMWTPGSRQWITCGVDLSGRYRNAQRFQEAERCVQGLVDGGAPASAWLGPFAELHLARGDVDAARAAADQLLSLGGSGQTASADAGEPEFDRRTALDLRLRIAVQAQEREVAVAVSLLLVARGEVDRLADVCVGWRGTPEALANVLRESAAGPHGEEIVRVLSSWPGLGAATARRLTGTRAHPQSGGPSADEVHRDL